jgi:hypothetical protein
VTSKLTLPMTSYQRPAEYVDSSRRRPVKPDAVSRAELLLFRLVERLSRRGKPGMVRSIERIVAMLEKPSGGNYSERSVWSFWKTLCTLRWIGYRIFRQRGKQYLEFWPLVRVEEPAERIFLRRKTAPSIAPSTPKNCTVLPHTSDSPELSEGENDNEKPAAGVVVSSPSASLPDGEALAALEAIGIPQSVAPKIAALAPASRVKQAAEVVRGILAKNGGNAIALAYSAVRQNWPLPAAPSPHASDRGERRREFVRAPEGFEMPASKPAPAAPVAAPYILPTSDALSPIEKLRQSPDWKGSKKR